MSLLTSCLLIGPSCSQTVQTLAAEKQCWMQHKSTQPHLKPSFDLIPAAIW